MNARRTLNVWLLAGAAAAAGLLTTGCTTPPPTAEKFASLPTGTVHTYHRRSSGSLGNFDGQVAWTTGPSTWEGRAVVASSAPQVLTTLHDPVTLAMLATRSPAGQTLMVYNPPMDYQWPLEVGKTWSSQHSVTMVPAGRTVTVKIDWKVVSYGEVTVPAGTFKAWQLSWADNFGETETRWVSPAEGIATIRRHVERPASHPQGAGVLDAELISRSVPPVMPGTAVK